MGLTDMGLTEMGLTAGRLKLSEAVFTSHDFARFRIKCSEDVPCQFSQTKVYQKSSFNNLDES